MNPRFHTLEAFEFLADAEMLRIKLESEGIQVILKDANIMQAEPFLAAATGGVKVQVHAEDLERAESIYMEFKRFALDKQGNPVICPNCKAARSERFFKRDKLVYRLFPFLEPPKYKCRNCGMITRLD